jgi:hypothetical protein
MMEWTITAPTGGHTLKGARGVRTGPMRCVPDNVLVPVHTSYFSLFEKL